MSETSAVFSAARRVGSRRRSRGAVALEVVIIVPLMLLVLLGFSELYLYMRATSLVEHTAFMLADSIGQMEQLTDDQSTTDADNLGALWAAAAALMQPEPLQQNGGVIITSVCDQTSNCNLPTNCVPTTSPPRPTSPPQPGTPEVCWQRQAPWTQGTMTSQVASGSPLPSTWPFSKTDSAFVVEVFYRYNPFPMTSAFWPDAPGTVTIYRRVYARPRGTNGYALGLGPAS